MKFHIQLLTTLLAFAVILLTGCSGYGIKTPPEIIDPSNQAAHSIVAANSRKPVELPPFPEPSFKQVIEIFKTDVKEAIGYSEVTERKQKVIDNPDMIYHIIVPETVPKTSKGTVYFYENRVYGHKPVRVLPDTEKGKPILIGQHGRPPLEYTGKVYYYTKEQEERMIAGPKTLSEKERARREYEIILENVEPLDAARYVHSKGSSAPAGMALYFAERAMRKYPDSVEAMRLWAEAHELGAAQITTYKQLLEKFPNSAIGHYELAINYMLGDVGEYELAIEHLKKASLLDNRLPLYNERLAECYFRLKQWEKALAVYQAAPLQRSFYAPHDIYTAQAIVYFERTGHTSLHLPTRYYDSIPEQK